MSAEADAASTTAAAPACTATTRPRNKLDYMLLSPALFGGRGASGAGCGRSTRPMTADVHIGCDHVAIYADVGLG